MASKFDVENARMWMLDRAGVMPPAD